MTNDTQEPQEYSHHQIAVGSLFHTRHGTKTTQVFLPAQGEASWSLLPSLVSLLPNGTVQHSATRKVDAHGDRSGLRKSKKGKHQH